MLPVGPGDVLAVRSNGFAGRMIRLGAALLGEPNLQNHIAVVHHVDQAGTTWVIEGRPGGVGWRDAKDYLSSRWTMSNAIEPKTVAQREAVTAAVHAALGTPYDWEGIAADAAAALRLPDLWREKWGGPCRDTLSARRWPRGRTSGPGCRTRRCMTWRGPRQGTGRSCSSARGG